MDKKRLQFDFTVDALQELDAIQKQTGFNSRADLIRHALRFLQWTVDETQNKHAKLLLERNGQIREIVLPFWLATSKSQSDTSERAPTEQVTEQSPQKVLSALAQSYNRER